MTPINPRSLAAGQGFAPLTAADKPASGSGHGGPHHHSAEEMHNQDVAHEHSDVSIRIVLLSAAGLAAVTAAAFVAMWLLFRVFEGQAAARDPQLSPMAIPAGQLPPQPRLETHEAAALATHEAQERAALEGYGWVDEKAGVARIPIDEAKKRLLERGIPVRATSVDPALGTHAPVYGEAAGGRWLARPMPGPGAAGAPAKPAEPSTGQHAAEHKGGM